jgi:hypothetical protein
MFYHCITKKILIIKNFKIRRIIKVKREKSWVAPKIGRREYYIRIDKY